MFVKIFDDVYVNTDHIVAIYEGTGESFEDKEWKKVPGVYVQYDCHSNGSARHDDTLDFFPHMGLGSFMHKIIKQMKKGTN